jgi:phosphoglycerol transferase MdoB-like AlkP superfamily enzyme
MTIDWGKVAPVIVSILIIIAVAVLRQYSRTFAAIAATMPINIPLALWIVNNGEDTAGMADFSKTMVFNMLPTVVFIFVAWLAFRAGWTLVPSLLIGYAAWGVGMLGIVGLRHIIGI